MAGDVDDVDDLLDEIEGSLQNKSKSASGASHKSTSSSSGQVGLSSAKTNDASDLLKSLDEIETQGNKNKPSKPSSNGPANATTSYATEAPTLKCRTIFLAGPKEIEYGHCSLMQEKGCDNMHCMKCDFQVLLFKGQHWNSSVNYMFFRNFMPDKQNLSKKLSKSVDHTAYCCQCSWISASTKKQLGQGDSIQWCCNSHKS